MSNTQTPVLPVSFRGARMVPAGVADAEMAALGFRASDEHRAFYGSAILVWRNRRWNVESGGLRGAEARAFTRYQRAL